MALGPLFMEEGKVGNVPQRTHGRIGGEQFAAFLKKLLRAEVRADELDYLLLNLRCPPKLCPVALWII